MISAVAALAALAALAATGVTVGAAPAQAAVPAAAVTWSRLMAGSLTVTATGVQLRQVLGTQLTTVTARTGAAATAAATLAAAQRHLITAGNADARAKAAITVAQQAVTTAKRNLAKVKPHHEAAANRARAALTAARQALVLTTADAQSKASTLTLSKAAASVAGSSLTTANAAVDSATAAVAVTRHRIAVLPTPAALAAQAAAVSGTVVSAVRPAFTTADTVVVYGTTVHRSISFVYQRMVDDAHKSGITLSGGGFRTKQRQIELRTINGCPDVYTAPSSSCRVPTAIPGRSLHEIGLAVDISSGGRTLTSTSPGFKWLKAHGGEYGFRNLPSEPWHWSITGS